MEVTFFLEVESISDSGPSDGTRHDRRRNYLRDGVTLEVIKVARMREGSPLSLVW